MAKSGFVQDFGPKVVRIALGLVLVLASTDKVSDPTGFADAIGGYRLLPHNVALLLATVLPWVELLAGFGLVFGLYVPGSALLASVMTTSFLLAVASALWRGLDISCGCFTLDPAAERIGWWKLGENALLLVTSFLIFLQSRR